MTWTDTKAEIFSEGTTCQVYRKELDRECENDADQADHAIFSGKQKNTKVKTAEHNWLNKRYNAQRACRECNVDTKRADYSEAVDFHIRREIERDCEGFIKWYYSAPNAVSRDRGSNHQVKSIIVERCLNE